MTGQQETFIPYSEDEVREIKDFSIAKQKLETLMDVLEIIRDTEMPSLAIEAKVLEKIDVLLDRI